MSPITIRPAIPTDVTDLWPRVQAAVAKMNAEGSDQWGPDYPLAMDYADDVSRGELLVAVTDDGQVVGACCVTLAHEESYDTITTFQRPDPAGVVHRMAVDPAFHRSGVAYALFQAAEAAARAQGAHTMHVDTYSLNKKMQALFRKMGYEKRGEISLHGRPNSFIVFEKLL